jgi:hypothetical protein
MTMSQAGLVTLSMAQGSAANTIVATDHTQTLTNKTISGATNTLTNIPNTALTTNPLDRANHTGTQTASTVSDFNSVARAQTEAELVAGTNITITPSGTGATRQLTIAASGGGGGSMTTQDEGTNLSTAVTTLNFTGAGVTASGAGATTTINIPGAGAAAISQATIDFGAQEKSDEVFSITDAAISATSKIIAFVTWVSSLGRDPDEIMADPISISVEPLAGSMNVYAMALVGTVSGKYAINYQIG